MTTIGFTGTQKGMTEFQRESVLRLLFQLAPTTVVHGVCVGSDADFHHIVRGNLPDVVIRGRPGVDKFGAAPKRADLDLDEVMRPWRYEVRNRHIVDDLPGPTDALIATPDGAERRRSGTWSTVRYAKARHRRIYVVMPTGDVEER
jgi:hypothetical protein